MRVWTIQLAKWRMLTRTEVHLVDTTVKSGIKELAPSWDLLTRYRMDPVGMEATYRKEFAELMSRSQEEHPEVWDSLLRMETVALACYCRPGKFCHRHLLTEMLVEYGRKRDVEVKLMGEWGDDSGSEE